MESYTSEQIRDYIRINRQDIRHWEAERENAKTAEARNRAERNLYRHMLRQIRLRDYLKQVRSCQPK